MRDNETRWPAPQAEADGLIEGRNAVIEALRAGTAIDKIYLARAMTPWWEWVRLMASSFRRSASTTTTPAARALEAICPRVLSVSPFWR